MSRIRTIKPEWTDDEALHEAGLAARVLSISLINLADDYGNGRANEKQLAARVFWNEEDPRGELRQALRRLAAMGYVTLYEVRGQQYFHLTNWDKHQRMSNAGKPRVPGPEDADNDSDSADIDDPAETRGESRRDSASRGDLRLDHDHDHDHDRERARGNLNPSGGRFDDPLEQLGSVSAGQLPTRLWTAAMTRELSSKPWDESLLTGQERERLQQLAKWANDTADIAKRDGGDWRETYVAALRDSLVAFVEEYRKRPGSVPLSPGGWWARRESWRQAA